MPSIDDFVNKRWADAKDKIRELDPSFVDEFESSDYPQELISSRVPGQRLSKKWRRLLEACLSLTDQAYIVVMATHYLNALVSEDLSPLLAGRQAVYHEYSWIIHINTLCERVDCVIKRATETYVPDHKIRTAIEKRHRETVRVVRENVRELRNEMAHGDSRVGVERITNDRLWEGLIAAGLTAQVFLDEHHYPNMGDMVKDTEGKWYPKTALYLQQLGAILGELEKDITNQNATLAKAEE